MQENAPDGPILSRANLSERLLTAEYAVRGAIASKGRDYQEQLKEGAQLPFPKVVACNIGEG